MKEVNIIINDTPIKVPSDMTIMEAARQANIDIPRLCFLKDINETSACRICVIELRSSCSAKLLYC